ncbi:uncharacterized protein CXQ87_004066 [Candidozyma duobushaemuli]|uniref:Uncharacterized protein n=2 Tax=Candidozyma TaxID=3303203 RepID=A0ABX8IB90_9ASCO|nr:uncharacterized protein CXQ87_004066 [[Candida] duobushaemulonis]PVH16198.1 hypothetical protein CXQ87_004066 [[Candida] duobushaemulonis]QWU89133.1 hypothetical protein CA3LBN_003456 [[Candida] haemuloni]
MLNTPIKKIRNLRLSSPRSPSSPVRYPSMSDLPAPQDRMFENMVDKGYSQTFSNSVLQELDLRAQEISGQIEPSPERRERRKRYSGAHKPLFQKMESISSHYAASRNRSSPRHDGSATKKRRTLNGPEEVFGKENESPLRRKNETEQKIEKVSLGQGPTLAPPAAAQWSNDKIRGNAFNGGKDSRTEMGAFSGHFKSPTHSPTHSPMHSPETEHSPSRFTRISPSKGHMNLNSLLGDDMDTEEPKEERVFAKPMPKQRQSSLQLAGVAPGLQKKPSSASLRSQTPQNTPSFKTPTLQNKPSIPSLQKKPSIPSLQKKSSIPTLQKKSSIPTLQQKPSTSSLQKSPTCRSLRQPEKYQALQKKPSASNLQKPTNLQKKPSSASLKPSGSRNFTIPQPFSLYDRPTVSSSQKTLSKENGRSPSGMSLSSMNSDVSQRSLSKFQKFKSRFA